MRGGGRAIMMEDNPLLIYRFWVFFMSWKLCNFCNKLNHTSVLFYFEEEPISSGVPSSLTKLKTYWWRSALGVAFRGSEGHPRDIFLLLLINMLTIHFVVPLLFLLFFFYLFPVFRSSFSSKYRRGDSGSSRLLGSWQENHLWHMQKLHFLCTYDV